MDEMTVFTNLTQLGAAGVIGWLWLSERRANSTRERELSEAHARIMREKESSEAIVSLVRENTEALGRLGESQRTLGASIDRLAARLEETREGRRAG